MQSADSKTYTFFVVSTVLFFFLSLGLLFYAVLPLKNENSQLRSGNTELLLVLGEVNKQMNEKDVCLMIQENGDVVLTPKVRTECPQYYFDNTKPDGQTLKKL